MQSSLQGDPDNAEFLNLKAELEEVISLTESAIAELKPAAAPPKKIASSSSPPPPSQASAPVKEKWSRENHPAFQAGYRRPSTAASAYSTVSDDHHYPQQQQQQQQQAPSTPAPAAYAVNDTVLAKWVSGDNAFYPARITSITGSSAAPVYVVTFKSYATTETLTAKDLKPMSSGDSRKRKADGSPASAGGGSAAAANSSSPGGAPAQASNTAAAAATSVSVISAAANIDPALANQARREPGRAGDGGSHKPAKVPRKVKANKELEAGKSKWQDFTSKGKVAKVAKKDSMFRTPEGVHGRGEAFFVFSFFFF